MAVKKDSDVTSLFPHGEQRKGREFVEQKYHISPLNVKLSRKRKMPYIKPELRPPFDCAVRMVQREQLAIATEGILLAIKSMPDSSVDGCLNYTFTQLFRKTSKLYNASAVTQMVIYEVFLRHVSYQKVERITGLLGLMLIEFRRRRWKPKAMPFAARFL